MPAPGETGVGILAPERVGKGDSGLAGSTIALEQVSDACQVLRDGLFERAWKEGRAIAIPLSFSHDELAAGGVEVPDPQRQAFEQSQAGSVQEPADEGVLAAQVGENGAHLFTGHHHGQTPGRSCSHGVSETFERMTENLSI